MITHTKPSSHRRCWPMLLSLLTMLALGESRADQWYLKIDGVDGDLTEGPMAGWSPLHSVGALVRLPVDPIDGTPGLPSFSCEVQKSFDRTSPALLQRCGQGDPIRRVTLAYVLSQPRAAQYRITLDNVLVSSVSLEGPGNTTDLQAEKVVFTFAKIEWACLELDANGGTTGGLTSVIDSATGQGTLKSRLPFRVVIAREEGRSGVSVTWPAEEGHRYQVQSGAALGEPWKKLVEVIAPEDGFVTEFVPTDVPSLFLRVVEVD